MTDTTYVKGYFRKKSKPTPPDPFAAQIAEARARKEAISKLQLDIRQASNSSEVPVLDHVPATPVRRPGIIDRFLPWFWRRG